jgi:hypothetical protein
LHPHEKSFGHTNAPAKRDAIHVTGCRQVGKSRSEEDRSLIKKGLGLVISLGCLRKKLRRRDAPAEEGAPAPRQGIAGSHCFQATSPSAAAWLASRVADRMTKVAGKAAAAD